MSVLHPRVHALPAGGAVHVGGVAGQERPGRAGTAAPARGGSRTPSASAPTAGRCLRRAGRRCVCRLRERRRRGGAVRTWPIRRSRDPSIGKTSRGPSGEKCVYMVAGSRSCRASTSPRTNRSPTNEPSSGSRPAPAPCCGFRRRRPPSRPRRSRSCRRVRRNEHGRRRRPGRVVVSSRPRSTVTPSSRRRVGEHPLRLGLRGGERVTGRGSPRGRSPCAPARGRRRTSSSGGCGSRSRGVARRRPSAPASPGCGSAPGAPGTRWSARSAGRRSGPSTPRRASSQAGDESDAGRRRRRSDRRW